MDMKFRTMISGKNMVDKEGNRYRLFPAPKYTYTLKIIYLLGSSYKSKWAKKQPGK